MVWPVAATGATVDGIVTPDAEQPDTAMNIVVTPSLSLPTQVTGTFEVVKLKLLAEAEGLQKKAEAWKNFNEAAVINMVVEKMPELAQAFATQLAGIDKINIIEMGNGSGSGVNKMMSTVGGGMTAMLAMLKDQFGIDIARLMQAKTDAAAMEAERRSDQP